MCIYTNIWMYREGRRAKILMYIQIRLYVYLKCVSNRRYKPVPSISSKFLICIYIHPIYGCIEKGEGPCNVDEEEGTGL